MAEPGQAPATGLTVAQAANAFEGMLTRQEGQSETETLQGDEPEAEEEAVEEPDEGDADAETEEQSEEPEAEPEEEEQPETHVVKIDGAEVPVTLDELKSGYQRDADYRRKTAVLAEERRALEPEKQAISAERARLADQLGQLEKLLDQPLYDPQELEWLRQNDRTEYAARMAEIQVRQNEKQAVATERQRLAQLAQTEQVEALKQSRTQEQAKLLAAKPEWKDQAKFTVATDQMRKTLTAGGFTDAEVDSIRDHRAVLIAHKAALWDALQAKAHQAKAKVQTVKTAKPGVASQQPTQVTEVTRAKQRLAQTGRVEDAAALFLKRIG